MNGEYMFHFSYVLTFFQDTKEKGQKNFSGLTSVKLS
jgi:hypothetical protein